MKSAFYTILICLTVLNTYATTYYVDENGSTGNFEIQHAIDKAADGDKIVIVPKSNGGTYRGFSVNKNNIEITSANENTRFKSAGFELSGNNNTLINAEIIGSGSGDFCRNTGLNNAISYCKFENIQLSNYFPGNLFFDQNYFKDGLLELHSGRVTGCTFERTQNSSFIYYFILVYMSSDDSLNFIGNKIIISNGYYGGYAPLYFVSYNTSYYANLSNNVISILNGISPPIIEFELSNNTSYYKLKGIRIENNCFRDSLPYYSSSYITINASNAPQDIFIKNNAFDSHSYISAPSWSNVKYNYFRYQNSVYTADSTNVYDPNLRINPNGTFVNNCNAINGGDPAPMYLDLDLTRNDAGCFGGSYSMANFTTPETGARVLFMKAPRVVYSNSPIEISADGIDK